MTPRDLAELTSLGLTVPTLIFCSLVVYFWWAEAKSALWQHNRDATQWLILGVTVGFVGSVVDNLYWGVAWTAYFLEHSSADWWFGSGVFPNIIFRQGAGIFAGYCHLRAANLLKMKWLTTVCFGALSLGVLFVLCLMVIKKLA